VFVSSTLQELAEERGKSIEAMSMAQAIAYAGQG